MPGIIPTEVTIFLNDEIEEDTNRGLQPISYNHALRFHVYIFNKFQQTFAVFN